MLDCANSITGAGYRQERLGFGYSHEGIQKAWQ